MMEYWRQCALWLINCKVLPPNHRVTWESAQVFDLAQTLRDGVLLCHLLNNLKPQCINLKEINLRPQMSQFLCLKNIRTFLVACSDSFGMKKSELFDAFDLFDVRNFGKVMDTLSKLSHTSIAQQTGIRHFPTEERVEDEDIYNHLEDLIDENGVEDEEDLYACVYEDEEGGEIYEDLMKTEAIPPPAFQKQAEIDIRSCCLTEIKQTEEKYTETLESIEKHFMMPLTMFFSTVEMEKVFVNIPELVKVHKGLLLEIQESVHQRGSQNLYQIFISFKERLLIYGKYCSHVETAITTLDDICKHREDVRMKLEECSKRANYGKFTLRDLLVVPMQRVLKYHLLLQELVKHTHDASEKSNLRTALDAMKDLAQYVNEVKRDNETLREIEQYQRSIENLNQPLSNYGRPKGDGEVRVTSVDKRAKQDRHIFLFDAAVIVCKRRGDNYEMKEVIDLHLFKITNNPTSDKENRKWSYGFYLTHNQGQNGFEFFFKTKELKKKWLEQFGMAISNIRPENATNNFHEFRMHTFERITSCNSCHMLLRGVFYQGYLCSKCGLGAHKECLGRFGCCGKTDSGSVRTQSKHRDPGLPKMLVIRNYFGVPSPASGPALSIQTGDIIELICADLHSAWWQGRILSTKEAGFFPSDAVRPCPCVPKPVDYSSQLWFAGPIERFQAEAELINRVNSTYLVRHRSKEFTEYAISIKYNNDVKHIKILTKEGCYYIAENKKFRSILELIEYYKHHSLREGFKSLDTTLQFPYREPENAAVHRFNRSGSNTPLLCGLSLVTPAGYSFVPPSSAPFWSGTVLTPKVIGVAIARYDFSSRDTRELSLQEGDVVKIYTKSGANGWWRGEVNGRVGWFPSTYVEEGEE
ncbi:PREDICTED: guanine nucleotide exchange factor VAV3 isoform X1 [Poecilia mexicana]|uniref:guanine nucleotide exchange factor VAV3 isoform X1 n=2 Tax=Poecilia mexicana TaxID=48701 RepID=UPI00072DD78C|nr:PREDICTED: guanine nucleotide exchange factor VAV3 isoform X1 [Poecilia mexicana]XP_016534391.1 PREDICTED: guanine nucleotide exchange factor VAV3 isoform X1 [Poecilia formosa]